MQTKPPEPFDPYAILQVAPGTDVEDIKRAYRKLSRNYHPDLNPDPEAQKYFLLLTNARDALADETGRENYEKYGHPDGRQSMKVGIALPAFMFQSGRTSGSIVLLALVCVGVIVPLMGAMRYIRSTSQYTRRGVLVKTQHHFAHLLKPAMGVGRMAEVFVFAMEIMEMKVKQEHEAPMAQLEKVVKPELSKNIEDRLSKLRTSIVKAYLLIVAYTSRKPIPGKLMPDLKHILDVAPSLLNEMLSIALTCHWLSPTMAIFEFSQCLVQAMSPSIMSPVGKNSRAAEAMLPLLQLPHFDSDTVKKLARHKIRSIDELYSAGKLKRNEKLTGLGFKGVEIEDVESALKALPSCDVKVRCETPGEEDIAEGDSITIHVYIRLARGEPGSVARRPQALREKEAKFIRRKKAVTAVAPRYPFEKKENWWILVADVRTGVCFTGTPASLIEAEALTLENPVLAPPSAAFSAATAGAGARTEEQPCESDITQAAAKGESGGDDSGMSGGGGGGGGDRESSDGGKENTRPEKQSGSSASSKKSESQVEDSKPREGDVWDGWQRVDINYVAPSRGDYEWSAMLMSDTWVGCNAKARFKFSVVKSDGENARRNFAKSKYVGKASATEEKELQIDSDLESGGEDNDDDNDDSDEEYDSDDGYSSYSGTEESDDERDETEVEDGDDSDEESMPDLVPDNDE